MKYFLVLASLMWDCHLSEPLVYSIAISLEDLDQLPTVGGASNNSNVDTLWNDGNETAILIEEEAFSTEDMGEKECGWTTDDVSFGPPFKHVYTAHLSNNSGSVGQFVALLRSYFGDDRSCNLVVVCEATLSYSWVNRSLEESSFCSQPSEKWLTVQFDEFREHFLPRFVVRSMQRNSTISQECRGRRNDSTIIVAASTCAVVGVVALAAMLFVINASSWRRRTLEESPGQQTLRGRLPTLLPGEPITPVGKIGQDNPAFQVAPPQLPSYRSITRE